MKFSKEQLSELLVTSGGGLHFSDGSGISDYGNEYTYYPDAQVEKGYTISTEEVLIVLEEKKIVLSPDNLIEDKETQELLKSWGYEM